MLSPSYQVTVFIVKHASSAHQLLPCASMGHLFIYLFIINTVQTSIWEYISTDTHKKHTHQYIMFRKIVFGQTSMQFDWFCPASGRYHKLCVYSYRLCTALNV